MHGRYLLTKSFRSKNQPGVGTMANFGKGVGRYGIIHQFPICDLSGPGITPQRQVVIVRCPDIGS